MGSCKIILWSYLCMCFTYHDTLGTYLCLECWQSWQSILICTNTHLFQCHSRNWDTSFSWSSQIIKPEHSSFEGGLQATTNKLNEYYKKTADSDAHISSCVHVPFCTLHMLTDGLEVLNLVHKMAYFKKNLDKALQKEVLELGWNAVCMMPWPQYSIDACPTSSKHITKYFRWSTHLTQPHIHKVMKNTKTFSWHQFGQLRFWWHECGWGIKSSVDGWVWVVYYTSDVIPLGMTIVAWWEVHIFGWCVSNEDWSTILNQLNAPHYPTGASLSQDYLAIICIRWTCLFFSWNHPEKVMELPQRRYCWSAAMLKVYVPQWPNILWGHCSNWGGGRAWWHGHWACNS